MRLWPSPLTTYLGKSLPRKLEGLWCSIMGQKSFPCRGHEKPANYCHLEIEATSRGVRKRREASRVHIHMTECRERSRRNLTLVTTSKVKPRLIEHISLIQHRPHTSRTPATRPPPSSPARAAHPTPRKPAALGLMPRHLDLLGPDRLVQ